MVQIKKQDELASKTILRTVYVDNRFFLFFTDATFCIFNGCGYGDWDVELSEDDFNTTPSEYNIGSLIELGFIDEKEGDAIKGEFKKAKKTRQKNGN